jgi:hypothetical protein
VRELSAAQPVEMGDQHVQFVAKLLAHDRICGAAGRRPCFDLSAASSRKRSWEALRIWAYAVHVRRVIGVCQ